MGQPAGAVLGGAIVTASILKGAYGAYNLNNSNKVLKKKIAKGKEKIKKIRLWIK